MLIPEENFMAWFRGHFGRIWFSFALLYRLFGPNKPENLKNISFFRKKTETIDFISEEKFFLIRRFRPNSAEITFQIYQKIWKNFFFWVPGFRPNSAGIMPGIFFRVYIKRSRDLFIMFFYYAIIFELIQMINWYKTWDCHLIEINK